MVIWKLMVAFIRKHPKLHFVLNILMNKCKNIFVKEFQEIVLHFGKYTYLLSYQELDEKRYQHL